MMDGVPRILIAGGGYGGMHTVLRLERLLRGGTPRSYRYHLLKLPTMNRRLRVVSDWTLALLFPREVVSLDVLEHPRQDFQAALRVIAAGPSRQTSFPVKEKREDDRHAYHR